MTASERNERREPDLRELLFPEVFVWAALMVLFLASWWVAYWPIGIWKVAVNLAVAIVMAGLSSVVFMHLARSGALLRLAAGASGLWLTALFVLTFSDYLTR
ncbi:cytochrome C oxidase subunit IV family protein [Afifella marina]|uniref:Cytochrome c oxidase subunit 4 n=1 Tax=Afifella marina DSM 2698 TaxID=1120955 RepID=A0A1G5MVY5_AFIMA|nr:cytochrome C oxidase subunit IV family protein [Afifella marina]MBK1621979.1 hypothetical protein [Afifella marina DSM 2698]MBK1627772.1 hypothetical protein [Afifella marina]MBK5916739.1 hypothetical protein [Afifella marina]RAI19934.1 hypothetical protein CH311_11535 [Afifella marina DSM 2698]SCZ28620.1 cytochrome c oxidase subunit 4 [Afifella marina DSM 2698]